MTDEERFDLRREEVFAAANDHVLDKAHLALFYAAAGLARKPVTVHLYTSALNYPLTTL